MGHSGRFSSLHPNYSCRPFCLLFSAKGLAQRSMSHEEARVLDHQNPIWDSVRLHLPDPGIGNRGKTGKLLPIFCEPRRFLEDATDYYPDSPCTRGRRSVHLLNKMGVTQMELRDMTRRAYFQRAVKINKKNAGRAGTTSEVIEYLGGSYDQSHWQLQTGNQAG